MVERFLRFLAFCDVAKGGNEPVRFAVFAGQRHDFTEDPKYFLLARTPPADNFAADSLPCRQSPRSWPQRKRQLSSVFAKRDESQLLGSSSQDLVQRKPKDFQRCVIREQDLSSWPHEGHANMQAFDKRPETFLASLQRFFRFSPFRDVADRKNYVCHFPLLGQVGDGVDQGPENLTRPRPAPAYDLAVNWLFCRNRLRPGNFAQGYFLSILSDGNVLELSRVFAQNLIFTNSKDVEDGPIGEERLVIRS